MNAKGKDNQRAEWNICICVCSECKGVNVLDATSFPGPLLWLLGKSQGRRQGRGPKNEFVLDAGDKIRVKEEAFVIFISEFHG